MSRNINLGCRLHVLLTVRRLPNLLDCSTVTGNKAFDLVPRSLGDQ